MHLADNTLLQGGKYRIVRFIASGGFGCTYEAVHTILGQRVAIKEYFFKDCCSRDDSSSRVSVTDSRKKEIVDRFRRKFIDEARNLWAYKHPGIVTIFDVFEENDTAYYVMDYIDGQSLSQMVKQRGPLPQAEALGYIRQVCDALAYVHAKGRLHLDIKPANIMVDRGGKAMLIDFGASKQFDEETGTETTTTPLMRSPGYAPIEQVDGLLKDLRASTDIYALGATLYKLLTGVTPPVATLLVADAAELAPLPSTVSPNVRQAILSALQTSRRKRPQSVAEFLAIIDGDTKDDKEESQSDSEATVVTPIADKPTRKTEPPTPHASTAPPVKEGKRRGKGRYILIGCCVLALAVGLFFFFSASSPKAAVEAAYKAAMSGDANAMAAVCCNSDGTPIYAFSDQEKREFEQRSIAFANLDYTIGDVEYSDGGNRAKVAVTTEELGNKRTHKVSCLKGQDGKWRIDQSCYIEPFNVNGVDFDMVQVEGGTFTMGATGKLAEDAYDNEKPIHEVTLRSYMIGETEVTQKLWKAVMGNNPSYFEGDDLPVEKVSWDDCQKFITRLNQLTGKDFRLPTEAEWEYAAKGGNKAHGYLYSGSDNIGAVAWNDDNLEDTDRPVAAKSPNELGLYDMSGSVSEWCSDYYGDYSNESQTNPEGPASGNDRVTRGGSWFGDTRNCRSSSRNFMSPNWSADGVGFRLALDL